MGSDQDLGFIVFFQHSETRKEALVLSRVQGHEVRSYLRWEHERALPLPLFFCIPGQEQHKARAPHAPRLALCP